MKYRQFLREYLCTDMWLSYHDVLAMADTKVGEWDVDPFILRVELSKRVAAGELQSKPDTEATGTSAKTRVLYRKAPLHV